MKLRFANHLLPIACLALLSPLARAQEDPLAPWRKDVTVKVVSPAKDRHSIHAYFNTIPESPDGKFVVYYSSETANGQQGDLRILDRATGVEKIIAGNITTEDAHRAACQQWASKGKRVVYHDVRDGKWLVLAIEMETGKEQILVKDRQVAWGQPNADFIPIYGCHWNPGEHRDLEIIDLNTGAIRKVVTAAAVKDAYPEWIAKRFGDKPVSIFFPVLSPDLNRIFFKMACGSGGAEFRSGKASQREGKVVFDLAQSKLLMLDEKWGHPAWHPDSRRILEVGSILIDTNTKKTTRIPNQPGFKGSHPSVSPDGKLYVTDRIEGGSEKNYSIVVGRIDGGAEPVTIHRFDGSQGAKSWRKSHPHPIFSADNKRIYFNVSDSPWTRVHVAQCGK